MIKAKEVSLKNIGLVLILSLAVSAAYFISKPHTLSSRSLPVFMGDEVIVPKAIRAATAVKAETMVTARLAGKVAAVPAPQPQLAAPLPIIPPMVALKVLPVYPASALEKNLSGTVLLAVYVGMNGQPEKIETRSTSGIAELDEAARTAVAQWKFAPATQGGMALISWFEVPVRFAIR
jgi:protein TonB